MTGIDSHRFNKIASALALGIMAAMSADAAATYFAKSKGNLTRSV